MLSRSTFTDMHPIELNDFDETAPLNGNPNIVSSEPSIISRILAARKVAANAFARNPKFAAFAFYLTAVMLMHHAGDAHNDNHGSLLKRTVINGAQCPKQRKQLNVFMAAFFGSFAAADQLYARNWALAVPKIIVLLPSTLFGYRIDILGFSALFAWTITDSVMWGVGFYTTHSYWGNPTKFCAVKGW